MQAAKNSTVVVASGNGELRFPLCWTSNQVLVLGYGLEKMNLYERGIVEFLHSMSLTDIHQLWNKEGDSESLELYLCEYCDDF